MTVGARARSPRALGAVCVGLGLGAAVSWAASALPWFRVRIADRAPVEILGAQTLPSLTGLALLALAGVAAVVATGGVLRRVLGGLVASVGGVLVGLGTRALLTAPFAPGAGLPAPPPGVTLEDLRSQPTETTAAPLLAVFGGVVLVLVGLFVMFRESRLPRLGSRYARAGPPRVEIDPDRAAWRDLDAGRDPTEPPGVGGRPDPGGRALRGDDPGGPAHPV